MARLVSLALYLCLATSLSAQANSLAAAIREFARRNDFAGTILVARSDSILYNRAFGLADRALGVPMRIDSKFKIASITKTFTAVLLLQLVDEGRVDLDATIGKYLPNYSGEGKNRVTIHQLLNHTSGIENFDQIKTFEEAVTKGIEVYQTPHSSDQLLADHASGKLVNVPGKTFDYNNADYIVLGKIIESVTGKTFEKSLEERILERFGLTSTGMLHQPVVVPGLVPTYTKVGENQPLIHDLPVYPENSYAAGSMYSTTRDLMKFSRALFSGPLLKPATLEAMVTPGLDDYGYGLWIANATVRGKKRRFAQRPGRIIGANTLLLRYLDDDVTVIILSNTSATDIDSFGFTIGKLVVK